MDKKLDDLFTSDMFMLADGYAGSTTISLSLVQMDHITITTTPLPPNANYTPAVSEVVTERKCSKIWDSRAAIYFERNLKPYSFQPVKDDLIKIEFEAVFSGADGQPPPRRDMDRLVSGAMTSLEIEAAANTQGDDRMIQLRVYIRNR